jgi:hypothetical protein
MTEGRSLKAAQLEYLVDRICVACPRYARPLLQNGGFSRGGWKIGVPRIEAFSTMHGPQYDPIAHSLKLPSLVGPEMTPELNNSHTIARTRVDHIQTFEGMTYG